MFSFKKKKVDFTAKYKINHHVYLIAVKNCIIYAYPQMWEWGLWGKADNMFQCISIEYVCYLFYVLLKDMHSAKILIGHLTF